MRNYELTVVIPSDVTDDDLPNVLNTVQGWIEAEGGKVAETKPLSGGRRKLAYPIGDYTEGNYVLMNVNMDAKALPEVERNLKLSQQIIRYLLIKAE
jgi:small subunit ribosomal protein S6